MHPKEISGGDFCRCEGTEQLRLQIFGNQCLMLIDTDEFQVLVENPMKNSRRRMCHVRGRELFIFYASVFKKVLSRFAGICPGADAFPAVPKVTQEPTSCPQIRLITPEGLMDIVITGVSLCSSFISYHIFS